MDLIFVLTTTVLIIAFCFLFQENHKIKRQHRTEILNLNTIISELLSIQNQQNGAVQLSDDLKIKLQNSRVEIDKKLLNLQSELIEKLVINELLD
jgi:hypothetical protein